jgi:transposase InsO family protein
VRVSASEKLELIHLVEGSSLSVRRTLAEIGLPRSTFYAWYTRYLDGGPEALEDRKPRLRAAWNRIPDRTRAKVIETALVHTELSPRELACRMTDREGEFLSESSVYRILKAADLIESPAYILLQAADRFQNPTRRRNELWQTDFTYLPVVGWGWYYLSTVLDDYSRKILAWKLGATMRVEDVTETLDLARAAAGVDRVRVEHKPRLLSDNGPCYVAKDLAAYLEEHGLRHTRGRPYHPMTQGKIERYHRSMKNVVRLENHYSPWELERAIARFVDYYNHERLHEAIGNVTPDDMYHGRQRAIASRREKIKRLTLERRKKENLRNAA